MDLRTRYPRSVREKMAGYVHLGRMLDKCRAVLTQTQGDYIYPCPMDQQLLEFIGVREEQFTEAVRKGSDGEVAEWCVSQAAPRSQSEIDAWNETLLARGPDTEEKWAYFKETRDALDPGRTDITSWADLLDLDEKRPVPRRDRGQRTEC